MIRNILNEPGRFVFVGTPCHIHGLRNRQCQSKEQTKSDLLAIGLICDRTLSYVAINHLIADIGETQFSVSGFEYRSKKWHGWPGDIYLRTHWGDVKYLPRKYRFQIKDIYTPLACRFCFDKMNILSDLVIGDAYKVKEDEKGYSVVITRSKKGEDALLAARDAGVLRLNPVEPEAIFNGQRIEWKRRDWTAYVHLWRQMGGSVPDFNIDARWQADVQNISLKPHSRRLKWARYLASKSCTSEVLKAAKRHVRLQRLWRGLTPRGAIGFIWRRLKKLREKTLLTGAGDALER